ncbi:hypothetical protein HGRIS_008160 [Hohenbuehelia grisea]|uniref:Amidase domain-containing protein n=1 Tax=Hohenbuehelia grisea TaxID=104357 RepID=A0ABR3J7B1_9AGAR
MSPESEAQGAHKAAFRPSDDDKKMSAYELWRVHKRKRDIREAYVAHWNATVAATGTGRPVDAIISPIAPYAAPPHGKNKSADYTMIWNLLDYTALVVPVTKVDPSIDVKKPPHEFLNPKDKETYELYDPNVFANAPVSIQVVGRTLEEEAVIGISEIVDAALKAASSKL